MKRIFNIALIAALLVSCNNFDNEGINPDNATTGDVIQFYASDNTKTTYFNGTNNLGIHWEQGDQIAVRLIDSNIVYPGTDDTTPDYRRRTNYTADTSDSSSTEFIAIDNSWSNGEMKWLPDTYENIVKSGYEHLNGQPIDNNIVAYYPATANASPNNISITLPTNQTQKKAGDHSHIGSLMVMKTSKQTWKADEEKPTRVGLKFRNVYSIIELTLKSNESGKMIEQVEINSASTALTFSAASSVNFFTTFDEDDENGLKTNSGATPKNGVKSVNTTLEEPAELTAEGIKVYFVVLPGEHANGDLTIKTYFKGGTYAEQKMGAITFEMNKVYRPSFTIEASASKPIATIKHTFSDYSNSGKDITYGDPIEVTETTTAPFIGRDHYLLNNLPSEILGNKISTIQYTTYPSVNKIEATSDGYVYLLVGGNNIVNTMKDASTILVYGAQYQLEQDGWTAVTTESNSTKTITDDIIGYINNNDGTTMGSLVLYEKEMKTGDTYDLTGLYHYINTFQGIRPIAKEITNDKVADNTEDLTLILDFKTVPDDWDKSATNFGSVVTNAYDGEIEITANMYGQDVALDFYCYKEDGTNISGTCYHNSNKGLLMNNQATKGDLSIGMPAIDGYQLKTVEIEAWVSSTVQPTVGLSSTEAPTFTAVGSDAAVWTTTNKNNQDNLVLTVAEDYRSPNTPYYFYVKTPLEDSKNKYNTARIRAIYLTYEKVE